jgi:predicted transcriptional regulator
MHLILSTDEQRLLEEILEERHLALQREIARTDHRDFKQKLRHNEELIDSMLGRLRGDVTAKAS